MKLWHGIRFLHQSISTNACRTRLMRTMKTTQLIWSPIFAMNTSKGLNTSTVVSIPLSSVENVSKTCTILKLATLSIYTRSKRCGSFKSKTTLWIQLSLRTDKMAPNSLASYLLHQSSTRTLSWKTSVSPKSENPRMRPLRKLYSKLRMLRIPNRLKSRLLKWSREIRKL